MEATKLAENIGYDGRPPIMEPVDGITRVERSARAVLMRNKNHCTCCWLEWRGLITKHHLAAAERLQDDDFLCQISPMKGSNLDTPGGGSSGPMLPSDAKLDAMRRKAAAMNHVGPQGAAVLEEIVLKDTRPYEASRTLGINERGVVTALQIALGALCAHYGLSTEGGK